MQPSTNNHPCRIERYLQTLERKVKAAQRRERKRAEQLTESASALEKALEDAGKGGERIWAEVINSLMR